MIWNENTEETTGISREEEYGRSKITYVEIVRCKDCVNYNIRPEYKNEKDARGRCDNISFLVGPYWFCADGERKEGGDGDA